MFTLATRTSSFINARLCCFDASMNHESDKEMKDGDGGIEKKGERKGKRESKVTDKLEKCAPISRPSFRRGGGGHYLFTLLRRSCSPECTAQYHSGSPSVSNRRYSFWRLYPHAIIS